MFNKLFDRKFLSDAINNSAESDLDRRNFLRSAGLAGAGAVGAAALGGGVASAAENHTTAKVSDGTVLNFALNLEYLEAQFYSFAVHGHGISSSLQSGTGKRGGVTGGHKVPFKTGAIKGYANEIAGDELAHVKFLRAALGKAAVAHPAIDLKKSFTAAATAAGLIKAGQTFDPFANEKNFLLGAFIFEDVGVTAYKGASPLITNKAYLEAAAGILAVEAYHAGNIRSLAYAQGLGGATDAISKARDSLDGKSDLDQGVTRWSMLNNVPTDANGIAFSRSPGQVLNVVYLTPKKATKGGFFPNGVNGAVNASSGS